MRNLILIKLDNEIITKKSDNNLDIIINNILIEFPNSNFFVLEKINKILYQIKGGEIKFEYPFAPGLYKLYLKHPEFLTNEVLTFAEKDLEFYEGYHKMIENFKDTLNKPLVVDKWKFYIFALKMIKLKDEVEPTYNQKYLDWIYRLNAWLDSTDYLKMGILPEDFDKIKTLLIDFDKPQIKALIKNAGYSIDIMDYKDNNDLFKIVNECYYSKLDDVEANDRQILYEKRKVFEFKNWLVVAPQSHTEAVTIGRGTNWCTSADSEDGIMNYHNYTHDINGNDFKLYIFINKNNEKQKFQWSEVEGDFLDWNDEEFEINEYFDSAFIEEFIYATKLKPFKFKEFLGRFFKDKYYEYFIQTLPESNLIMNIRNNDINTINYLLLDALNLTYGVKFELIQNNYGLDILINDTEEDILQMIIKKGYGLDILINNSDFSIRTSVALTGYGLDILINDENSIVNKRANDILRKIESGELQPYINDYGFECYK